MQLETITQHKGKLFSGEYKERSTGTLRRFGGVLTSITGSMITFEGRYKTFCLDFRSIVTFSCRSVEDGSIIQGGDKNVKF